MTWDGSYEDLVFDRSTIHVHVPCDPFLLIREWDGTDYVGWYVNLAAPWQRTSIGFDTLDHSLDVEIANDLSDWAWKDGDELAWAVQRGRVSPKERDAIRQGGAEAITRMNENAPPFFDDWSMARPDPTWPIPRLPVGWDRIGASTGDRPLLDCDRRQ